MTTNIKKLIEDRKDSADYRWHFSIKEGKNLHAFGVHPQVKIFTEYTYTLPVLTGIFSKRKVGQYTIKAKDFNCFITIEITSHPTFELKWDSVKDGIAQNVRQVPSQNEYYHVDLIAYNELPN